MTDLNTRQADYPIDPIFLERWSPRAFTDETMTKEQLMTLFEAARWAPSASNMQPWSFVYALRGSETWDKLFGLVMEGNQRWVKSAAALVFIISKTHNRSPEGEMKPIFSHAFDAGAAWHALSLQAISSGFHAHAMGGIEREKAQHVLGVPEGYRVEAGIAIGKRAPADTLPDDLKAREVKSSRKPASEFVFEGHFAA
ncbi:nitroreductase family protein [Pararhizobium sp.]|uniref:nitroreductase family protein n=1 Tax=Pararhizobium sp. TaxID=1977563 RepID=UPI00271A5570|nr:nitroreductase family protein [Pararhizobium sp.]MDO9416810.1 nitroreductase family protein [Pararhizobium sp.]